MRRFEVCGSRVAFTLIELLIVVAIIAILAAIAVPNFLEAQTRSKISRVKADMRSASVGIEAYIVDNGKYPCDIMHGASWTDNCCWIQYVTPLTTPVAYLTSTAIRDPFTPTNVDSASSDFIGSLRWIDYSDKNGALAWGYHGNWHGYSAPFMGYCLYSYGPMRIYGVDGEQAEFAIFDQHTTPWTVTANGTPNCLYDATNGTKSKGCIARFGGGAPGPNQ
jgi:prepilin-type N-terminal cleavage/methylation domain-containing protein